MVDGGDAPPVAGARTAGISVLVVCRANRGRSPVVAELLRQYADQHGVQPPPTIVSCGLEAREGEPLLPSVSRVLRRRRLALADHVSRPFAVADAGEATLIITFERALTRAIVARRPHAVPRTFTLRELSRLVRSPLWRSEWNGAPDVVERLHALRPMVEAGDDDTPDPVGERRRATRRLVDGMVKDVATVAPALFGPAPRD